MAKQATDTVGQFNKIKSEILSGDIKPFYLLFGKEHYYIDQLCELLQENVVPPQERDFGQIVLYGADTSAGAVVSAARQFPMMIARQIVVLKEAQMMSKVEDIASYFSAIMPTTVLVVCYKTPNDPTKAGKSIDKRTSFYKQAQKVGVVFESEQIPDYKIARWIEDYTASLGYSIDPEAAALIGENTGVEISSIVSQVDKLIKVLPQGQKRISTALVEENVGISRAFSVFELTKALSLKDALKCYKVVHFFSESGKRYPIQMTIAALSNHFIKILRYHALLQSGLPQREVLLQLGINPYFGKEYEIAAKNYPLKRCMGVIAILKEYDYRSKSNARGNASDGELLQELVARVLN